MAVEGDLSCLEVVPVRLQPARPEVVVELWRSPPPGLRGLAGEFVQRIFRVLDLEWGVAAAEALEDVLREPPEAFEGNIAHERDQTLRGPIPDAHASEQLAVRNRQDIEVRDAVSEVLRQLFDRNSRT